MKRGYRLRIGDQIPTTLVSIISIMSHPKFQQGVDDVRAGRGFPNDYDSWAAKDLPWCYERGRQWAARAPCNLPLKVNSKVTQRALRWFDGKDIL